MFTVYTYIIGMWYRLGIMVKFKLYIYTYIIIKYNVIYNISTTRQAIIKNDDLFEVCLVGEHTRKQWIRISKSTRASRSWIRIYESTVSRVFSLT